MQTFLPYKNFSKTAECLSTKHLGKQRVEVLQILNTLTGRSTGWSNHPAVRMWRGYERALCAYGLEVCAQWRYVRGFKDTCWEKIYDIERSFDVIVCEKDKDEFEVIQFTSNFNNKSVDEQDDFYKIADTVTTNLTPGSIVVINSDKTIRPFYPSWLTDEFCLSHRSNLIRKNPDHYRPLWPDVPDNLPYIWPDSTVESEVSYKHDYLHRRLQPLPSKWL